MSAQEMSSIIANAGQDLNLDETDDDLTVLTLTGMQKNVVNIMVGPPADREDDRAYFETFFQKEWDAGGMRRNYGKAGCDYLKENVVQGLRIPERKRFLPCPRSKELIL